MRRTLTTRFAALATACALFFGSAGLALAQDAQKIKEIDFEEDTIEGTLASDDFVRTTGQEEQQLTSLVRAREGFADKLLADIQDL